MKSCNDMISREILKGLISDKSIPIKFEEEKRGDWRCSLGMPLRDIYKTIDNAPTVEVATNLQPTCNNLQQPQGEWIEYDNTFYKCPECGYLLEKCCPQCQNKVILPKGGAE